MDSDARELRIRMEILKALDDCRGYWLRQTILMNQLNVTLEGICVGNAELQAELETLRSLGLAEFQLPLGSPVKDWRITQAGKERFRD